MSRFKSAEAAGVKIEQWTVKRFVEEHVTPWKILFGVFAFLAAAVWGGVAWVDGRYAKADQVTTFGTKLAQVERRLEVKILGDLIQTTQARIWQLEDRLRQQPGDQTAAEEIRRLTAEKQKYETQLRSLSQ